MRRDVGSGVQPEAAEDAHLDGAMAEVQDHRRLPDPVWIWRVPLREDGTRPEPQPLRHHHPQQGQRMFVPSHADLLLAAQQASHRLAFPFELVQGQPHADLHPIVRPQGAQGREDEEPGARVGFRHGHPVLPGQPQGLHALPDQPVLRVVAEAPGFQIRDPVGLDQTIQPTPVPPLRVLREPRQDRQRQ